MYNYINKLIIISILVIFSTGKVYSDSFGPLANKNEDTYEIDGIRYKNYKLIEYPVVFLNVIYTAGFASDRYSPNNKEGVCNIPFWGGFINIYSIGTICYFSYKDRPERTSCEFPVLGGMGNVLTLGGLCNRPSEILSKK
jgi:hypothetical protein